jgi:hypothetical protein
MAVHVLPYAHRGTPELCALSRDASSGANSGASALGCAETTGGSAPPGGVRLRSAASSACIATRPTAPMSSASHRGTRT